MPTTSHRQGSPSTQQRSQASGKTKRAKPRRSDLLILECDSATLVRDRLNLGSVLTRLITHPVAKLLRPDERTTLLRTSTKDRLLQELTDTLAKHGRFRAILLVGHSNATGLQLTSDVFCDWRTLGEWLQPFEPEFLFLAACEAGKSEAVRDLFKAMNATLLDIYASPVRLHDTQASALLLLIGMLLWSKKIDDENSFVLRSVNYINTGGQVYRWSKGETGPGQEIAAESWDKVASFFDRGPWDLSQILTDFLKRGHQSE